MLVKATYTIEKKDGTTQRFSFESDKLPNEVRNFFIRGLVMQHILQRLRKMDCYRKVSSILENEYGEKISCSSIKDIMTGNYSRADRKRKSITIDKQRKRRELRERKKDSADLVIDSHHQ